jgi:hypothetical protein
MVPTSLSAIDSVFSTYNNLLPSQSADNFTLGEASSQAAHDGDFCPLCREQRHDIDTSSSQLHLLPCDLDQPRFPAAGLPGLVVDDAVDCSAQTLPTSSSTPSACRANKGKQDLICRLGIQNGSGYGGCGRLRGTRRRIVGNGTKQRSSNPSHVTDF